MSNEHRVSQVTLPGLSFKDIQIVYVKMLGKIVKSERVKEDDDKKDIANVAKVLNLKDNKIYRLICPTLMVSSMNDEEENYVGKCYEVVVSAHPAPGKRYKTVDVYEIDPEVDYSKSPSLLEGQEAPTQS